MAESLFQTLSRVYTYKVGYWPYVDSKQLSPYRLASEGYFVSKPFVLECFVCHHQVAVPFEIEGNGHVKQLLEEISKHKDNCIYYGSQDLQQFSHQDEITKEQLYLLMDQITLNIKQGYNLLKDNKKFPGLDVRQIKQYIDEEKFLFKSINQAYNLNWPNKVKILFFLYYFGWGVKKSQEKENGLCLECLFCGRNMAVEDFQTVENEDQEKQKINVSEQQSSKYFSPVSEHRYFCIWVNPKCSGYKGYTILLQHLYDKIVQSKSLFPKRPHQQTKKIRVQLDKYLQSFQQKTNQQFHNIKTIFEQCTKMSKIIEGEQKQKNHKENLFEQGYKRMEEFNNGVKGQIKDPMKKIKL